MKRGKVNVALRQPITQTRSAKEEHLRGTARKNKDRGKKSLGGARKVGRLRISRIRPYWGREQAFLDVKQ